MRSRSRSSNAGFQQCLDILNDSTQSAYDRMGALVTLRRCHAKQEQEQVLPPKDISDRLSVFLEEVEEEFLKVDQAALLSAVVDTASDGKLLFEVLVMIDIHLEIAKYMGIDDGFEHAACSLVRVWNLPESVRMIPRENPGLHGRFWEAVAGRETIGTEGHAEQATPEELGTTYQDDRAEDGQGADTV